MNGPFEIPEQLAVGKTLESTTKHKRVQELLEICSEI